MSLHFYHSSLNDFLSVIILEILIIVGVAYLPLIVFIAFLDDHLFNGMRHFWNVLAGRWRFMSLVDFIIWMLIYSALLLVPDSLDILLYKQKTIQFMGGSAAISFIVLASNKWEQRFLLNGFFLSSLAAATLFKLIQPIEALLYIAIYLFSLLCLPMNLIFLLVLLARLIIFSGDLFGASLLIQTAFLYCFKQIQQNIKKLLVFIVLLHIVFIFCWIFLGTVMLKVMLFPLSGALSIFFFYVANSDKSHVIAFVTYILNGVVLCFLFENHKYALYLLLINLIILLIFIFMTFIVMDRNGRKLSFFPSYFRDILAKGKKRFFFIYFGLVFLLLQKSGSEQWMQTSAYSLIFQVSVLEIFLFLFLMIETDRAKGLDKKGGEKKKNEGRIVSWVDSCA